LSAALSAVVPARAQAQDACPSRSVTLIVAFPAGSGTGMSVRLRAKHIAQSLRHALVVENRPGANGALGAQIVARVRPDGHPQRVGAAANNASSYAVFSGRLVCAAASSGPEPASGSGPPSCASKCLRVRVIATMNGRARRVTALRTRSSGPRPRWRPCESSPGRRPWLRFVSCGRGR
jgi:hypothetical protein